MLLLLLTALHDAGFFKRSREGWHAASHRLAELAPARTPRLVHEQNKTHGVRSSDWPKHVPKIVYLSWKDHNVPDIVLSRWRTLNPGFTISLFNDSEAAAFLEAEFGEPWLSGYRAALSFSGMAATDLWRFLILYARGGVYADIDVEPIVGLHHFVWPTDDFITVGSLYPRVVNPLFLVARRGEPMLRRAALNHLIAVNRTLRAKVGLPWEGVGREKSVPNEYSANSCFTLGKEVPAEVLANTKNLTYRVGRYGGAGGGHGRDFHLLHEITLPSGPWRDEHIYAEMNFTFTPDKPPPRLFQGLVWPDKHLHKKYGKERAAVDGDRIVAFNRWRMWGGEFGKGNFRYVLPPPPPPPS